jgi:hypothetical protein
MFPGTATKSVKRANNRRVAFEYLEVRSFGFFLLWKSYPPGLGGGFQFIGVLVGLITIVFSRVD